MHRLIMTTSDSGAGCLKASGIADEIVGFVHRLVSGPVPAVSDPTAFFAARADMLGPEAADWERNSYPPASGREWQELILKCKDSERIEVWIDPTLNAQLQLLQLLDWFSSYPEVGRKLVLFHADMPIGEQTPEDIALIAPR